MTDPHPVHVVWETLGKPDPATMVVGAKPVGPPTSEGTCGLTGEHGPVWSARVLLGASFTQWDRFTTPWFSAAAVTVFKGWWARMLTAHPERKPWPAFAWEIRANGTLIAHTRETLHTALCYMRPDAAIACGRSRQKHTLPWTRWGYVTTDDDTIPWGPDLWIAAEAAGRLRAAGVPGPAFTDHAPPPAAVEKLGGDAFLLWDQLQHARKEPGLMPILEETTRQFRPPKETP